MNLTPAEDERLARYLESLEEWMSEQPSYRDAMAAIRVMAWAHEQSIRERPN